jgi:predicted transcriptional regulator
MNHRKQARISLHVRRIELEMSMTELARKVGRRRESVSRAVNQGKNRLVLEKVKEVLGVQ